MHATATKGESSQDAAVSEATASLPIPDLAAEQTPLWAQAVAPIQAKLRINRPGDKYEQEADRVADQVMRRTGPIAAPVIREESADPERENQAFGVWRSALPSITPAPRAVIQRVPGDVTRVNHHLLTLFLSSYEGGPLVPLAATQAYLSNPPLLAMGARLRDRVLANQQGGNAPLTLEQFYQLALGITPHRGTALLLAHNVSKGFARGSAALNITRLDAPNYYRLFAAASLGTTDPGDRYHYFVISIPAYYFSAGAADTALPPEGDPNESFGTSMRRGLAVSFVDALRGGLRDRAIPASAGYDGWLAANAISFAEGGFWGHGQAEVLGESLVHLQGAMTGVEQAGQTVNQDWRWYVPISRGIGDAQHPDADLTLANYGRIQREGPTPFTYRIYDPRAQMVQQVNTTVPRPAADQSAPAPAPAPSTPTPAPSGSSGSSTGRGILRKAKENGQANGVGLPDGLTAVAGTVHGSSGRALDGSTRSYMETRFGRDFGDVRIHTDAQAAASAAAINARAYTVGRNIVFGAGEYRPIEQQGPD